MRSIVRGACPGCVALIVGAVTALGGGGIARADGEATIALSADGADLAAELGLDPVELETKIETRLNELYDTANVDGFLRAFANATSFASRGTGADYAPVFRNAEVGITVNAAAAVEGLEEGEDPAAGVAANVSFLGGLNLARWDHPEVTLYGNGFYRSASLDQLEGSIANVGVHGQYHLLYPAADASALLVQWSGVHLTAGVEVSRWRFAVGDSITRDFTIDGNGGTSTDVTAAGGGRFDLSATSVVVPIEVTTSLRFLYFFGAFVGGGIGFQAGGAHTNIGLSGAMTAVRPSDGARVDIGSAAITATGDGSPSSFEYHLLAGIEANLWRAKLVVQATFVPIDGASIGAGLRFRL